MQAAVSDRRGFLKQLGASCLGLPLGACGWHRRGDSERENLGIYQWSGIGFGIDMSMEIHGVGESFGEMLGRECEQMIGRLEAAFSLYQENSELSRLNRQRVLAEPSDVFAALVDLSLSLERRTLGYFQPAIHGVWEWLVAHDFSIDPGLNAEWQRLCGAARGHHVQSRADGALCLTHPLTRLSMNAIGQGYLADCVAAILRRKGVRRALLHLGETYAIGDHPDGRAWKLAVMGSGEEAGLVGTMELIDAGLAVSTNEPDRLLVDPVNASLLRRNRVAAVVSSEGAAVADAFATAYAVAPESRWRDLTRELTRMASAEVRVWSGGELVFNG